MTSGTQEQFQQALDFHRNGKLEDAEKIYREILAQHPQHPQAMHFLGVIALQVGRADAAIPLLENSVRLNAGVEAAGNLAVAYRTVGRLADAKSLLLQVVNAAPQFADAWANLASAHQALGELEPAVNAANRAIHIAPNHPGALSALAAVANQRGDIDHAIQLFERVVGIQPNNVQALVQLGILLKSRRSLDRALRVLTQATTLAPNFAEAHGHLASTFAAKGDFTRAIASAQKAVGLAPNVPAAHMNLADVYLAADQLENAEAAARKTMDVDPNFVQAWGMLAVILDRRDQVDGAVEMLEKLLKKIPDHREAMSNLARSYSRAGRHADSIALFEKILAREPNNPDAHGGLSLALLGMGDWKRGFLEYEWRWHCDNFTTAPRDFERPLWQGSDPKGRTILVHSEQGYGDVIQFARYLPRLIDAGAKVIVECPLPLRELIENIPGVAKVVPLGLKHPDFDLHLPLLSLPRAFSAADIIPDSVPYLFADEARLARFRQLFQSIGPGLKVGLMWAGNKKPDPKRTCPFDQLAPLLDVPDVQFISFQKDDAAKDLQNAPAGAQITDLAPHLQNFADTAAALNCVDLMITIDTACAHLAGATGTKTWTLLPFISDWRWLRDRDDSPWYPTMKLFRQSRPNNWTDVIARVREALIQLTNAR
jgi:tetratricopeptide (TPR) repeat protein